jgi:hypothetical protein
LLAAINTISVEQAFELCTILSALACLLAATRILFLASSSQYRPFLGLLAIWFAFCVASVSVPMSSKLYLRIYILAAPVSWLFYLFVARDIYLKIFVNYRGIAFAGRFALYSSGTLLLAGGAASVWFSPARLKEGALWEGIALVDRSVLFGVAFLLVLLVFVIVRYPISIQRNLIVHTLVFSGVLFCQSLCQAADQWTAYNLSMFWNTLAAALDTVFVAAWAIMIHPGGDNHYMRFRPHIKPETELHLLHQLDSLNGILLRAARK